MTYTILDLIFSVAEAARSINIQIVLVGALVGRTPWDIIVHQRVVR